MNFNYTFPQLVNDYITKEQFEREYQFPSQRICDIGYKIYNRIWLRTRLAEAQNWRCCWCGRHVTLERDKRTTVTLEHLVPRSKGGTDSFENCVMACSRCNSNRDIIPIEDYYFRLTGNPYADINES